MMGTSSWTSRLNEIMANTYEGVDHSLPGNGGPECTHFLTLKQKLIETLIFTTVALLELYVAKSRIKLPDKIPVAERGFDRTGKKILLVAHTLTFGIELGYKLSTRQTIFLLNPCHVVTMMQVRLSRVTRETEPAIRDHLSADAMTKKKKKKYCSPLGSLAACP